MKGGEGLAVSVEARRGLESPPSRLAVKPRTVNSYRVAGSKNRGLNVHIKRNIHVFDYMPVFGQSDVIDHIFGFFWPRFRLASLDNWGYSKSFINFLT